MLWKINGKKMTLCRLSRMVFTALTITALTGLLAAVSQPKGFSSGEEAVNAFIQAVKEDDNEQLLVIFGSDANELIFSGDKVADRQGRDMLLKVFEQQHRIEPEGDKLVLIIGKDDWPFPIPLIQQSGQFVFDTAAGKEEILNRRIGRNELNTIQVLLAYVDAQREYAMKDHDGDGLLAYAQKVQSDPGKKNGLYWETKESEPPSPLGPLFAKAREEGYSKDPASTGPQPYHGYCYRILTAQGPDAPGGAFDYLIKDKMIGGFAAVAYPVDYGNSGVMTFIVNHLATVYQTDLGDDTEQKAKTMTLFNPDKTWTKVE